MCGWYREELTVTVNKVSALSHCVFAVVIYVITGEVRKEPFWTMTFANDICLSRMKSEK